MSTLPKLCRRYAGTARRRLATANLSHTFGVIRPSEVAFYNYAYQCGEGPPFQDAVRRREIAATSEATEAPEGLLAASRSNDALWSDVSLIGVAFIWGVNIPIMKIGLEQVDVFVFNAVRLTISAMVLATFALLERRRGVRPLLGASWPKLAVYGLTVSAVYQLLFLLGISRTSSGATGLIIATVPLWTAILASLFAGERLAGGAWGGLAIALAGTIVVTLQQGAASGGSQPLVGNLIILVAAMTWAGGTVYSRSLLRSISPLQLSAVAAVISVPFHWLVAVGRYGDAAPAFRSPALLLIILYSGVFSSGLALPMWNVGVRHAGAAHASVIQNLVPLVAIFAAWPIRGETPPLSQLGGGALILGGLVVMRRNRR